MHALLLSMLQACAEDESTDTLPAPPLFTYECGTSYIDHFSLTLSDEEFTQYLVNGELTEESCAALCTEQVENNWTDDICSCHYQGEDDNGSHLLTCGFDSGIVDGRVHANIPKLRSTKGHTSLGCHFSKAYHAEASSVAAFLQLRKELAFHNAPIELQKRCLLAAREEISHAQTMAELAKRYGGKLPPLSFGEFEPRSLIELTIDNAVEGCIFETFAALQVLHQFQNTNNLLFARRIKQIMLDEIAHAELAWDIHRYLMAQLSTKEQVIIQSIQRQALRKLECGDQHNSHLSVEEQAFLGLKDTRKLPKVFVRGWKNIA